MQFVRPDYKLHVQLSAQRQNDNSDAELRELKAKLLQQLAR